MKLSAKIRIRKKKTEGIEGGATMLARGSEKASGEMTFKWRLKEVEEETPMGIWTKGFRWQEQPCKGPEVGVKGHGEDSGHSEVARRLAEDLEQNCRGLRLFLPSIL